MSHLGRLLVATPLIGDPNFERSVIFLLAHDPDGAFGIVLNRPSDTPVHEVVDGWSESAAAPAVLFFGGPVTQESVIGVARHQERPRRREGAVVVGDLATVDLHTPPEAGEHLWGGLRLFAGSAGWAPGQLEDEISEGSWWAVDGSATDVLTDDPSGLWARVLRRQRGQVAWFANHPHDPTAN